MQADHEFPMSREDAAALLVGLRKPQLVEMARTLGIPGVSKATVADLRREIVDSTVGRRLDSIATRGFRGARPDSPDIPDRPHAGLPDTAPRGQEPLRRPGDGASSRVRDFETAWKEQGFEFPGSLAKRSTEEIRKDIASGKITPDEGVRRLESEIEFNKSDLAEIDLAIRDLKANPNRTPEQERQLIDFTRAAKVARGNIKGQEDASTFLRRHFNQEPIRTDEEIETIKVEMPQPVKSWLDEATPDDMRETAEKAGLEPPKGDTTEEMFNDLMRQTIAKALAEKEAKKVAKAAKKAAPAKVTRPATAHEGLDIKEIGKGLNLDVIPPKVLQGVQDDLDAGKKTPAQIGRELEQAAGGSMGPYWGAVVRSQVSTIEPGDTRNMTKTPEEVAKHNEEVAADVARLQAEGAEWKKLADRLKATRRKRLAAPKREPAVLTSKDEAKAADIADLTGVSPVKVQQAILDQKEAKAPASDHGKGVADLLGTVGSREEADALLKGKTKAELLDIAKAAGAGVAPRDTKAKIQAAIVGHVFQARGIQLMSEGGFREEPSDIAAEVKKLRDHAEVTRRLASMRLGNNKPGSFHHNKGLQDIKDADRMDAEADALEKAAAPVKAAKKAAPAKAAKAAVPGAPKLTSAEMKKFADMVEVAFHNTRFNRPPRTNTRGNKEVDRLIANGYLTEEPDGRLVVTDAGRIAVGQTPRAPAAPAKAAPAAPTAPAAPATSGPLKRNRPALDTGSGDRPQERPNADEPISLGRGQMSGTGNMHGDSEIGKLWNDLYRDDRAPNSLLNELARLATSMSQGDRPFEDVLADLRKMASSNGGNDPQVAKRIQEAVGALEAPAFEMPDLPDSTPEPLRRLVADLGKIPTARRRGVQGTSGRNKSVIDDLVDAIGRIDRNEGDHFQNQRELEKHPLHESRDGATQIWRLFDQVGPLGDKDRYKAIRAWMRERDRAAQAAPKPSGDRPPEAEILRMSIPELRELAAKLGMANADDARKDALLEFLLP